MSQSSLHRLFTRVSEPLATVGEEEGTVMTIAATPTGLPNIDGVTWRALRDGLWVGRREGRHIGAVEHGHRWLASDADGEPIGTFRSFQDAQAAVVDPAGRRPSVRRSSSFAPVIAVGVLGAAAIVSAAGWIVTGSFA
jgi:hypothetical protein